MGLRHTQSGPFGWLSGPWQPFYNFRGALREKRLKPKAQDVMYVKSFALINEGNQENLSYQKDFPRVIFFWAEFLFSKIEEGSYINHYYTVAGVNSLLKFTIVKRMCM